MNFDGAKHPQEIEQFSFITDTMFIDTSRVNTTVVVSTVSVVLAAAILTTWWQKKRRDRIPTKWRRVGELVELQIYPLKSGAATPLNEAECTDIGIQTINEDTKLRDRFFIVVTEKGIMKTARQHPKLYFIKVCPGENGTIIFKAPNVKDLSVNIPAGPPENKNFFKMHSAEEAESVDCGDEAAKWMHSYLEIKETDHVRLGYHLEGFTRRRDFDKKPWTEFRKRYLKLMRYDSGAYSDMAPFLIVNEASVNDLNGRVPPGKQVQPSWFRPNFVVRGPDALSEDTWNYIKIGDSAIFQNYKPCLRCIMVTMNPETSVKDPDLEPLKTLRKYRLLKDPKLQGLENELAPIMGCYMGLRQAGTVKVGDPVYVEERER